MTEQRIEFTATGGPEVLRLVDVDLPPPAPGEVRVRTGAVGLNFIDTYLRSGLYPVPALPSPLGYEAAGTIEALGDGVSGFAVGDRVGIISGYLGTYATAFNAPAAQLIPLPAFVSDEEAAALLLKGGTVEALVERCAKVQPGWTVLVHAAAGGVGLLMVQWLKAIGCTVIGTAGGAAKLALAREAGADHVIDYTHEDVAARVREITSGKGVPVVFDGVGKATWEASLGAVAPRGLIVSYGNASGPVTGVALGSLMQAGSVFVTRPTVFHYQADAAERAAAYARVFAILESGAIGAQIGQRFALAEVAEAHHALESRATTGSTILVV